MGNLLTVFSFLLLTSSSSPAQDPGAQAAQQAMQQAQQAQQFAIEATQQAQQDAQRAMQNATHAANAQSYQPYFGLTSTQKFSVKPGAYSASTKVKLTDATRGAIIYYTTDGWTPTAASQRYMARSPFPPPPRSRPSPSLPIFSAASSPPENTRSTIPIPPRKLPPNHKLLTSLPKFLSAKDFSSHKARPCFSPLPLT